MQRITSSQRVRLKVFNPEEITIFEIEELITKGYRFDIVDGLEPEEYDKVGEEE